MYKPLMLLISRWELPQWDLQSNLGIVSWKWSSREFSSFKISSPFYKDQRVFDQQNFSFGDKLSYKMRLDYHSSSYDESETLSLLVNGISSY